MKAPGVVVDIGVTSQRRSQHPPPTRNMPQGVSDNSAHLGCSNPRCDRFCDPRFGQLRAAAFGLARMDGKTIRNLREAYKDRLMICSNALQTIHRRSYDKQDSVLLVAIEDSDVCSKDVK